MQEYKNIPDNKNNVSTLRPVNKAQKAPAKKKKKISIAAVFCILLILAVGGACAAVYFDIAGAKQMVISFLKPQVTAEASPEVSGTVTQKDLDALSTTLQQRKTDLDAKEKRLKQQQSDLSTKEDGVKKREDDVKKREDAVAAAEEKLGLDTQSEEALNASAKIFEQMDAVKAAKAISEMKTTKEMADVLLRMSSSKAALIMNNMKSSLAAKILAAMVK